VEHLERSLDFAQFVSDVGIMGVEVHFKEERSNCVLRRENLVGRNCPLMDFLHFTPPPFP
jgi:hypothetical protein